MTKIHLLESGMNKPDWNKRPSRVQTLSRALISTFCLVQQNFNWSNFVSTALHTIAANTVSSCRVGWWNERVTRYVHCSLRKTFRRLAWWGKMIKRISAFSDALLNARKNICFFHLHSLVSSRLRTKNTRDNVRYKWTCAVCVSESGNCANRPRISRVVNVCYGRNASVCMRRQRRRLLQINDYQLHWLVLWRACACCLCVCVWFPIQ